MARLPAGKRDQRIDLQRATLVADDFNEDMQTWITFATVWAEKRDVSDGERVKAAEVAAEISTRFTILWSQQVADLSPKDRVLFGDRVFDIYSVKELDRRKGLEITATARADG